MARTVERPGPDQAGGHSDLLHQGPGEQGQGQERVGSTQRGQACSGDSRPDGWWTNNVLLVMDCTTNR